MARRFVHVSGLRNLQECIFTTILDNTISYSIIIQPEFGPPMKIGGPGLPHSTPFPNPSRGRLIPGSFPHPDPKSIFRCSGRKVGQWAGGSGAGIPQVRGCESFQITSSCCRRALQRYLNPGIRLCATDGNPQSETAAGSRE